MVSLSVRYAYDLELQKAENAEGRNYWFVYVEEILSRLGCSALPVELPGLSHPSALDDVGVLFLGDYPSASLPGGAERVLEHWARSGGVLVGFMTQGLDGLFGISAGDVIPQARGPFSINGYYELRDSEVTEDCRTAIEPDQKLIIVSPIRSIRACDGEELARLFFCDESRPGDGAYGHDAGCPAIMHRRIGNGHAFYFAFDVAQTMWTIQQGRPVDDDYDCDGYLRISDASVIGENSRAVPYTDCLHVLLANMIGRQPVPMIHQIPPREGRVAPALLFFGGDDEGQPGIQLPASGFMASRGLPYHINAMPAGDGFAITREDMSAIEANGHTVALHWDFISSFDHPSGFTQEDIATQAERFREEFGRSSVCGNMHWCRWSGWAEPARWISQCGALGDNSYVGWTSPPLNPVNTIGFTFGSAFPRRFRDDAAHGNAPIDLIELPITAYEVGYEGERFIPERIREALDLALKYHLTLNVFWHPVYLANYPACRQAVDELVRLMGEMEVPPVLMEPDGLCRWWNARSRARIRGAEVKERVLRFSAECDYEDGFVVKVPIGEARAERCRVDGAEARFEILEEFGQHWAFVALTPGRRDVEFEF